MGNCCARCKHVRIATEPQWTQHDGSPSPHFQIGDRAPCFVGYAAIPGVYTCAAPDIPVRVRIHFPEHEGMMCALYIDGGR